MSYIIPSLIIILSLHAVHNMNAYMNGNVCLRFNSRTAGQILMNFGMDIMSLEAAVKSCSLIS
jgi:hypothetical protein